MDAIINLDHGDPIMYEPFWQQIGDRATIVILGSQTMSYFSNVSNICWFLEPKFAMEIHRIHRLVGNAITENQYIVVGMGSTQLFQAALYALSPSDATEPMSVASAVPYYSSYPMKTDFLQSGLCRWAGEANAFKGDSYIEVVCYPNNPDGLINKEVLNSENGKTIHNLAYYWPQGDHDIMLFTVSRPLAMLALDLGKPHLISCALGRINIIPEYDFMQCCYDFTERINCSAY